MKTKQTALYPGNEDKVGYWLTPPDLMKQLQDEFDFDFDACPYPRPAGFDGLKESWGKRTYVNPPFQGGITKWVNKALSEIAQGKTVVLILPLDGWVAKLVRAKAEIRSIGFVKWQNPEGKENKSSRPNFLFILRGD